jgi:8-oxo-dGTP pyrophosphatase MutT (NUDIX family)
MIEQPAKGVTVTFTPIYQGRYLFVQRHATDDTLPGYWCFPGGKVNIGETIAGALVRELKEETGLDPTGRAFFVNSYLLGNRVGAHFAVEVSHDNVALTDLQDHRWVKNVNQLAAFTPRIAGIDNHLLFITRRIKQMTELAQLAPIHADSMLQLGWQSLAEFNHIESGFLNR